MSAALFKSLEWLPAAADFTRACQALAQVEGEGGRALQALATQALTDAQLTRLCAVAAGLRAQGRSLAPLRPYRLGLVGNSNLSLLAPALMATGARHGLRLDCVTGGFGQAAHDALSAQSAINRTPCDGVLIALDAHDLPVGEDAAAAERAVSETVALVERLVEGARQHGAASCLVQTIAQVPDTLFGSLDRMTPGTARHTIDEVNRALARSARAGRFTLLDVDAIAQTVGLAEWHSQAQWHLAKLPFAQDCLPLYAEHVCRVIAALCGKSRRVLVLDLDNTLWGGVIGDDGMAGIVLGQGDATGEAFLAVQRMALRLSERGVVLAVSSKNDDAVARQVFRAHPEMLLREEHIAVFQANWQDKATNIRAIAEALSLGLDACVLLDDNPAERALVRRFLPEVAVPELPDDPALYPLVLSAAGYFEAVSVSEEDRSRASYYRDNARRAALGRAVGDLDDYLAALNMEATFLPFDAVGRARICQLINKSNQFNLTTRRYTEAELCDLEADETVFTLQVRLKDRFGDNGMISAVICREDGDGGWLIDTWLMSCRVLGRGVERMVLSHLLGQARQRGIGTLIGQYRPTPRNGLVRDHYAKLGFARRDAADPGADGDGDGDGGGGGGETFWTLSTVAAEASLNAPPNMPSEAAA